MTSDELFAALKSVGYRVYDEDDLNWTVAMCEDDDPLIVPKDCPALVDEVVQAVMQHARINKLNGSLAAVLGVSPDTPPPPRLVAAAPTPTPSPRN